jgi:hypothetical protein
VHLAEINIGRLIAPAGDPRVAEFMDNLDRINGLGKRMPGFVWMMEGSGAPGTGNTENVLDDDPQLVANLTVWESPAQLQTFVFDTLHARFMDRRAAWFEVMQAEHFAMWWIPQGHRPTLDEGRDRIAKRAANGDSPEAFGWDYMRAQYLA